MSNFNIGDDILDTRDLIEHLEDLKRFFVDDYNATIEGLNDELLGIEGAELNEEIEDFKEIDLDVVYNDNHLSKQHEEIEDLQSFHDEFKGYGDFEHGEALINEDYFTEYVEHLLIDCGYIADDFPSWIEINWDNTAFNVRQDYMEATIYNQTYLMRV